ncbi:MAG TPA: hypothetical protein VKB39_00865 [Candidatus Baltobacteraceae bacterium]|nr:hypothetical protein [Candidatus Baltobacteraceae bacterium]
MRKIQAAFYGALVLVTGAISAIVAHAVIDWAGDFLLPHDSYDGIAHRSPAIFAAIAVAVAAVVALRFLWEALDRRCTSLTQLLRGLRAARGASPWRFVALVVGVATIALLAMEYADALSDRVAVDGIEDLLGGSIWLGLGSVIFVSVAVAWCVRFALHALADWEPVLAALFERLLELQAGRAPSHAAPELLTITLDGACRLARRSGKRAPPFPTPA